MKEEEYLTKRLMEIANKLSSKHTKLLWSQKNLKEKLPEYVSPLGFL